MFKLTNISDGVSGKSQIFIGCCNSDQVGSKINVVKEDIIRDYNASLVAAIADDQWILKLVKPRSIHEYFKMLWFASRASKEVKGNFLLKSIGIDVPQIVEYGYGFIPASNYHYIGFIVMENLRLRNFDDAQEMMHRGSFETETRKIFFAKLCKDIATMRANRVVFNDLKLGNVFSDENGDAIWIDTGVSCYSLLKSNKFRSKHNFSLNRFLKRHEKILNESEVKQIKSLLID